MINKIKNHLFIMKKIKYLILFPCLVIGSIVSCTPDYVTDATPAIENPSNPSGQSITLNFTSGEFIGVLNNANFINGAGAATKSNMGNQIVYLLTYMSQTNNFNANITNKENNQLSNELASDGSLNVITIITSEKKYESISGTYEISQEQVVSSVAGTDIIKCKLTFNGTFEVTPMDSFEVIETGVKINGTIVF